MSCNFDGPSFSCPSFSVYPFNSVCIQMSALQEFCATTKDYCPPGIPGPPGKLPVYTVLYCLITLTSQFTVVRLTAVCDRNVVCCLHV